MFKLTPPLVNWPGPDCDDDREDGFTLIEILVVIIIIGILAAVAIPIFLNQQKAARDSATTQDTRNAATALESGLVYDDTATSFKAYEADGTTQYAPLSGLPGGEEAVVIPGEHEEFYVQVGDGPITKTKKTEGTSLLISNDDIDGDGSPEAGAFRVDGWNEKGREHVSESTLVYRNGLGGIQSTTGSGNGGISGGDETENAGGGSGETEGWWSEYQGPMEVSAEFQVLGGETNVSWGWGEVVELRSYAYVPEQHLETWGLGGSGDRMVPDGTIVEWAFLRGSNNVLQTGSATTSGGYYQAEVTLPSSLSAMEYNLLPTKLILPDGKERTLGAGDPAASFWIADATFAEGWYPSLRLSGLRYVPGL